MSIFWISNWTLDTYAEALTKALKTAPGSAEVRLYYGVFRLIEGKVEKALSEILLAKKLDPLNSVILTRLGYTYLCVKEFELAREQFREAHALVKMDMYYQFMITWSYLLEEKYERAEAELQKIEEGKDGYHLKRGTAGYLHARLGRREEALQMVDEISSLDKEGKMRFSHLNLSLIYSGLDQREQMYSHLEKAFNEKAITLMFIQADPFWENYWKEARFKAIVDKAFHRKTTKK
jgi:tetratricopeptide (TPR) repeat protein